MTGVLHKLPLILGNLPLGFIGIFFNNILLDTSTLSSLLILPNSFGKNEMNIILQIAWHEIQLFLTVFSHVLHIYEIPSCDIT